MEDNRIGIGVDLDDVKEFVMSDKFSKFLLNNTTDFATACYILQTLFDSLKANGVNIDEE